ncbi:MAG: DUF6134 family protein [Bacteroidota bacterium]
MKTGRTIPALMIHVFLFITCSSFIPTPGAMRYMYSIIYNGKKIGRVSLLQQKDQQHQFISIHTTASVKKIVTFDVLSRDEAMFDNGVLMWSSVYREVNGKEHENKKTKLNNSNYDLHNGDNKTTLSGKITGNMINLYVNEPANEKQIYSDSHQQFVNVSQTAPHVYAIDLPDGSHNTYQYTNNVCSKVSISTRFYDISFELEK